MLTENNFPRDMLVILPERMEAKHTLAQIQKQQKTYV